MKKLNADIKNKSPERVYLLCGSEDYLKRQYRDLLVNTFVSMKDMDCTYFQGKSVNFDEVADSISNPPFFSEYRCVVIENSGLMKKSAEEWEEIIYSIPESTIVVFSENNVDKRNRLYKAVKDKGYICEFKPMGEPELTMWAARKFKNRGLRISRETMGYFLSNTGTDMNILSSEIEKLSSYCFGKGFVEKSDIDQICVKQLDASVFDIIDSIAQKNQKKTISFYYELLGEKEAPMNILYWIGKQFERMIAARDMIGEGLGQREIAGALGIQDFAARKCISQSRNFSIKELKTAFSDCVDTEDKIKKGILDENAGVEMLLIKYTVGN